MKKLLLLVTAILLIAVVPSFAQGETEVCQLSFGLSNGIATLQYCSTAVSIDRSGHVNILWSGADNIQPTSQQMYEVFDAPSNSALLCRADRSTSAEIRGRLFNGFLVKVTQTFDDGSIVWGLTENGCWSTMEFLRPYRG